MDHWPSINNNNYYINAAEGYENVRSSAWGLPTSLKTMLSAVMRLACSTTRRATRVERIVFSVTRFAHPGTTVTAGTMVGVIPWSHWDRLLSMLVKPCNPVQRDLFGCRPLFHGRDQPGVFGRVSECQYRLLQQDFLVLRRWNPGRKTSTVMDLGNFTNYTFEWYSCHQMPSMLYNFPQCSQWKDQRS